MMDTDIDQSTLEISHIAPEAQPQENESPSAAQLVNLEPPAEDEDDDLSYRERAFDKRPLDWEQDLELQSKFLDRKDELKAAHLTYMRNNPELQALVADFLQHLLLRRPENVYNSAAEFFSTFGSNAKTKSTSPCGSTNQM